MNKMLVVNLNIHNKLRLKIVGEKGYHYHVKRVKMEYDYFVVDDPSSEPDVFIKIGKLEKLPSNCFRVDDRYLVYRDSLCAYDSYKVAKWGVYMEGLKSDKLCMIIQPNIFASYLIPAALITPSIAFCLLKKSFLLVHAAGISNGKHTVLFTGVGGAGKTSFALRAVRMGLRLLGDDHVILDGGRVFSFPTAISIFKYNMPKDDFFNRWKTEVELKNIIHKVTFGYFNLVTKVPPKKIPYNMILQNSELRRIVLLEPHSGKDIIVEEIGRDELVESWMANMFLDGMYFYKYLFAYSYVNSEFSRYLEMLKQILLRNLGGHISLFKITYPQHCDERKFDHVISLCISGI